MKFGKYLASRQLELPEYLGHFIDYKALKKLIKQLGMAALDMGAIDQHQIQQKLKENKASFFFRVERELDKVNSFYLEKQANLTINLDLLVMKKNEILGESFELMGGSTDAAGVNFKNSIIYLNLYQSFKKIHQDLLRLQQFIELNEVGFSKVVKKWDKRSKSHTKELFIQTAVSVQPVFHKNEINQLSDLVTLSLFDLDLIMDGDYSILLNYKSSIGLSETEKTGESTSKSSSMGLKDGLQNRRHNSITGFQNTEIDELYSSFVNVATTQLLDLSLLSRWIDKVKSTTEDGASAKFRLSKIFSLSIGNLKIADAFLEGFLEILDYDLDFEIISDDFNNNKSLLHECCSITPTSAPEGHAIINNGVKVINSNDSINHLRKFIVEHILGKFTELSLEQLLVRRDFNGKLCIHYAAQNNRIDLLEILLPRFPRSHIDDLDNESMSALLLAIKTDNFEIITSLLENGSNPFPETSESKLQYLPINYACKFGKYKTLEYLLRSSHPTSEMLSQQDVEGLLPLHVVARAGNFRLIKLLIQYGADVNRLDGLNKWPPIFYAALEGHVKTAHELIKQGAKLDIVDGDGYSVLYYCGVEGHIEVLNQLITYIDDLGQLKNDRNLSADSHNEQSPFAQNVAQQNAMSILDADEELEDSNSLEKNIELIPHLQLPPPILPMRRYGHNFLEQKVLIELIFPHDSSSINLFNSAAELHPGRITILSNISDIVPRNILLPMTDGERGSSNCIFQTEVDSLNEFRIDFEIFPKFGTRLISKTTALNFSQIDTLSPEINSILLPLFDLRLRNIGELKFNYQVIFPFSGILLETTKYDTYWKSSTSFVKNKPTIKLNGAGTLSPNNFLSPSNFNQNPAVPPKNTPDTIPLANPSQFVTATSLSGEYLRIKVTLLNDGTPVVCPHWAIAVADNIELFLPNMSLEQLSSMTNSLFDYEKVMLDLSKMSLKDIRYVKKLLKIIYLPLDVFLNLLDFNISIGIELVFPSLYELSNMPFAGNIELKLNTFIDRTLNIVFDHIRSIKARTPKANSRPLIFLSSNSIVCKILNWKQPNFPVFLVMNGIVYNNSKKAFEARTANGLLMEEFETEGATRLSVQDKLKHQLLANDQELTIRSIKEAVNFAIDNNLIGIITSIHLLNIVPKLVPLIRSRGLVLVASNDIFDPDDDEQFTYRELDSYSRTEINGLRFDDVLSFKEDNV